MEEKESGSVRAVEGRIPMTSFENTVGYLEEYAERVLPVNIYQEFLHSKRKPFYKVPERDFFVQAPGVLSREALRFCSLLNLQRKHNLKGQTIDEYTFLEAIGRSLSNHVQRSEMEHRGNHCLLSKRKRQIGTASR